MRGSGIWASEQLNLLSNVGRKVNSSTMFSRVIDTTGSRPEARPARTPYLLATIGLVLLLAVTFVPWYRVGASDLPRTAWQENPIVLALLLAVVLAGAALAGSGARGRPVGRRAAASAFGPTLIATIVAVVRLFIDRPGGNAATPSRSVAIRCCWRSTWSRRAPSLPWHGPVAVASAFIGPFKPHQYHDLTLLARQAATSSADAALRVAVRRASAGDEAAAPGPAGATGSLLRFPGGVIASTGVVNRRHAITY
jgi:hypothetical protein